MKPVLICLVLILSAVLLSFAPPKGGDNKFATHAPEYFFNYKEKSSGLHQARADEISDAALIERAAFFLFSPDALPQTSFTGITTIIYASKSHRPALTLTAAISRPELYGTDTTVMLQHLRYLHAHRPAAEAGGLTRLSYNGFDIYGSSASATDSISIPGTFVMFPGGNVTVSIEFLNPQPAFSISTEEYKARRNAFLGGYTAYLHKYMR